MRLLLTRPEPGAARTAQRLRERGHGVVSDPMLRIEPVAAPLPPGSFDAIAFTSANGVRAAPAALPDVPVFSVGGRTAEAARARGLSPVIACAGDARALADALRAALPPGARILNPAGVDRAADLPALVAPAGLEIVTWEIYRARPAGALSPDTRAALAQGRIDGALHFSARTAGALLDCVATGEVMENFGRLRHFCLSPAVAAVLAAAGIRSRTAPVPEEAALLALLEEDAAGGGEVAPEGLPV